MSSKYDFKNTKQFGSFVSLLSMQLVLAKDLKDIHGFSLFPQEYNELVVSYSCREMYELYLWKDTLLIDIIKAFVLQKETINYLYNSRFFDKQYRIHFIKEGFAEKLEMVEWVRKYIELVYAPIASGKAFKDEKQYETTKTVLETLKQLADEREAVLEEWRTRQEIARECYNPILDGTIQQHPTEETLIDAKPSLFVFNPPQIISHIYGFMDATGCFKKPVQFYSFVRAFSFADFSEIGQSIKRSYLIVTIKLLEPFVTHTDKNWIETCSRNLKVPKNSFGKNKSTLGKWTEELEKILHNETL
ncbi:MAG: hypothetical protein Q4E41_10205 [Bacteroidales bacterium]|nr:hypothetical protein [Bacteroidales bacterium]